MIPSTTNQCQYCPIACLCIPSKLERNLMKHIEHLKFKALTLKPGDFLCHEGDETDHLFIVRTGLLKSYTNRNDGQEFVMDFHLPPELFGWEGTDPKQKAFNTVALDISNVCIIPMKDLQALMHDHPALQSRFFELIQQRIRNDNIVMQRTSVQQRLANFLFQLGHHYTQLGYPKDLVKLPMTHHDIANYLRIAPETISRAFHRLQEKGMIKLDKKSVHLLDIDHLKRIAELQAIAS